MIPHNLRRRLIATALVGTVALAGVACGGEDGGEEEDDVAAVAIGTTVDAGGR